MVALLWVGSAFFAWDQTPWAHRHDSCEGGLHLVAAPHLTIPVTQGRYSSGPVSSAAQAEDALAPPLESPRETVIADPTPIDAATLRRLQRTFDALRAQRAMSVTISDRDMSPLLAKSCRD